jgi:hypothetical protein
MRRVHAKKILNLVRMSFSRCCKSLVNTKFLVTLVKYRFAEGYSYEVVDL